MSGVLTFLYGLVCYGAFFCTFLYTVGFLGDFGVPKSIDSGAAGALLPSLAVDALLLALFAVQHSGMARRRFKRWWNGVVTPAAERSTYVLTTSLVLIVMMWQWRPLPAAVWRVEGGFGREILWGLYALGWLTVLGGTFMISHTHLFGVSQVWARLRGRKPPELQFQTRWLYRHVRHPLMLGFIVAFWATPSMSLGHLVFAAGASGYILLATLRFEEPDLEHYLGETYRRYRERVPAFIPRLGRGVRAEDLIGGGEPALEESGEAGMG